MDISVIIPHYPFSRDIDNKLQRCVDSLSGYDELLIIVNEGTGFAKAVNQGLKLAKGEYLMVVNNDIEWRSGNLKDLCIEDVVTSPTVNGASQPFWGSFFCIPRKVYEKIGGLDEQFEMGYYEDEDYIKRLEQASIPMLSMACDIWTLGGSTMDNLVGRDEILKENRVKFEAKWK
jgi:GT2 family glycosyltransferase